jgi:hypothetical protein
MALTCTLPFDWTTVLDVDNEIVDWLGASKGTLLQPPASAPAVRAAHATRFFEAEGPVMMESIRQ